MASGVAPVLDERYELGALIGTGAIAVVHRGWDRRLERGVAVKCLRPELAVDELVRVRFEEEARAAAGLTHRGIVAVYDTGEADGTAYIVMECLPGRTLGDRIAEEGALPAAEVAAIGRDLAAALAAAHTAGVLHRDVKPANVLLDERGGVKLADFGIAKSAESSLDLTLTGTIIGSPAYLSPERIAGEPATVASDLYALGVVLWEAVTGERPFRGDTPVAVAHDIHTRDLPPVADVAPGIPTGLAVAIDRALARDPSDRPSSAEALADLLDGPAPPGPAPTVPNLGIPGPGDTQVAPVAVVATSVVPAVPRPDVTPPEPGADAVAPARPLPAPADRGPAPTGTPAPGPGRRPSARARRAADRRLSSLVLVGLAFLGLVALGWAVGSRDGIALPAEATATTPTTAAEPTATLPPPLDDALDGLDEAVDP